jgi:hypothetical protein
MAEFAQNVRGNIEPWRSITWTCLQAKATCLFSWFFYFFKLLVAELDEMVAFRLIRSSAHWRENLQGDFRSLTNLQYPPLT